jgi:adenine-specific DNA-methyltransferase
VKDGNAGHITREPEQVKAFRDTWRDRIHSYLTYLRDRLTVARELLTESGSIFVQIGDENVHRVRAVMDEVFGERNLVSEIVVQKTYGFSADAISNVSDYLLWFAKRREALKARPLYREKPYELGKGNATWVLNSDFTYRGVSSAEKDSRAQIPERAQPYNPDNLISQGRASEPQPFQYRGVMQDPFVKNSHWKPNYPSGLNRLLRAERIHVAENSFRYRRFHTDFVALPYANIWTDTGTGNFTDEKIYVVQTGSKTVERCLLTATDPGDLVLDPTCGSGTTATVAEQWGRRWITIDTSRVALALARARIMGARYPFYLLADSREGQLKEAEVTRTAPSSQPVRGNIRHGFVFERVPHITLKSIANNAEIDVIWEKWQETLEPLRAQLNKALGKAFEEWEVPREAGEPWPQNAMKTFYDIRTALREKRGAITLLAQLNGQLERSYRLESLPEKPLDPWPEEPTRTHAAWWEARIARQKDIDASIAAKAEFEYLYDKAYEDKNTVRVAGPFTVESLSPHRVLGVDENDELIDGLKEDGAEYGAKQSFPQMILENLKTAGVQQAHKDDKITFTAIAPWPGDLVCAEARYMEGDNEKRAAIFIGPEFGTVQRADLVAAAREAGDAAFDALIACAFNYEAHTTEFSKLGRIPVLKARMNADLHMAEDLKNTGKGNLFVIFGEPDITRLPENDGKLRVKVNGVDVFKPQTGEVISDSADGIACWFIDTDYNEESFFVRHAYFLGANDPYSALKTTLKAEINEDAWATLNSDTSRPFEKPKSGRIAVKVINHLGDEVMKVFKV